MLLRPTQQLFKTGSWRAAQEAAHFDVCIIGGGPGGIAAALRAVNYNKSVCLIEQHRLGGADLWNGALQSKTLWQYSKEVLQLRGAKAQRLYGEAIPVKVEEAVAAARLREVSETRERQIAAALEATKVQILYGQATFVKDGEVQCVNRRNKEYVRLSADYFVIATGSTAREHPFVNVDGELVVTSDHLMHQPFPKSLVVVGAGVVGCEFASIFAGLGSTQVSIIDKASRILPREDSDIVHQVEQQMEQAGVNIHHDTFLYDIQPWKEDEEESLGRGGGDSTTCKSGVQYTIMNRRTQELTTYQVDRALIAVGRKPNYKGLGIENTTLKTHDGRLVVDDYGRCVSSHRVFVIGDASGGPQLVSVAEAQAEIAIDCIYGTGIRRRVSELPVPSVAFLSTAVAATGLNEVQCRQQNIAYYAASMGFDLISRSVAALHTDGMVKILVSHDAAKTILGVRAVGMNASTLVDLATLAIARGQSVYDLVDRVAAYPAVSQAFQECLRVLLGQSQLKPGNFDRLRLTEWTPDHYQRGGAFQAQLRKHRPQ